MSLSSQQSTDIVTAEERKFIDRYTLRIRKGIDEPGSTMPLHLRIRKYLEGLNRRIWYKLFRFTFRNEPATKRIPIEELESVFILPIGDAIGDMVVTLPLIRAIKRRNPRCRIGTLVSERNKALLRCDKDITATYQFRGRLDLQHFGELFRARQDGYQVVLNMQMNRLTEYGIFSNIIAPRGVKVTNWHPRHEMYSLLFNKFVEFHRNSMHLGQLGLCMLESVVDTGTPIEQWESRPTIAVSSDIEDRSTFAIESKLQELGASWYILFNTQARNPFREWGFENTLSFAREFVTRYPNAAILFSSSPVRRDEVRNAIAQARLPRCAVFETSYDLLELSILARRSQLVITPDTSVIHFATAEERPSIVLWTDPSYLPLEWIPLQVPSVNLCPTVLGEPVDTIPVADVLEATSKILSQEWQHSSTSMGLCAEHDPLYQAAYAKLPLQEVIALSAIPKPVGASPRSVTESVSELSIQSV